MKWLSSRISNILFALSALIVAVSVCVVGYLCWDLSRSSLDGAPYFTSKLDTSLEVQTDGSAHVIEQRTFTIKEDSPDIAWFINNIGEKSNFRVDSVRVSVVDQQGQITQTHRLAKAAFDISWIMGEEGLGFAAFDFDYANRSMHLYTSGLADTNGGKDPKTLLVTTEYSIKKAITAYRDVSELAWVEVSGASSVATQDVSLTVSLPVQGVPGGEAVRTWAHGPTDGTLSMDENYLVSYRTGMVDVWQFANVSVVFPTSWLSSLSAEQASLHANELYLEEATLETLAWKDTWHLRSMNSYAFDMVIVALSVALCLFALALYFKYGRSRKPDFTDTYCSEVPQEGMHPAVASRIWRWNRPNVADLRAAIVHLVALGAIDVEDAGDASAAQQETSRVAGYRLRKVPAVADKLDDPVDNATLWLLFTVVANRAKTVRVQELRAFKRDHADKYQDALKQWQATLSQSMDQEEYFEEAGKRWQMRLFLAALFSFAAGVALFLLFDHPVNLATLAAAAVVMALVGNYIPRRTEEGNNISARSKALRNWLRDPHECESAAQLCSFMPYACAFEVGGYALDKAAQLSESCSTEGFGILDDEDAHWRCCYVTCLLRQQR